MMNSKLMRLLRDNVNASARKPFQVEAQDGGEEATLYIYDVIVSDEWEAEVFGGVAPETFVKTLANITAPTIHLRFNSPGGSVFAARAMEAAIRGHSSKIIAHVDGYAASAASILAVVCDEVEMAQGAMMMIHNGWCLAIGNSNELMDVAALLEKLDATLAQTYANKTGIKPEEVAAMMNAETWMTGQEAVDLGFADRLMDFEAKAEAKAWNLAAYERAPVAPAPEPAEQPEEPEAACTAPVDTEEMARRLRLIEIGV